MALSKGKNNGTSDKKYAASCVKDKSVSVKIIGHVRNITIPRDSGSFELFTSHASSL